MYIYFTAVQKIQLKSCREVSYACNIQQFLWSSRSCPNMIYLFLNRERFLSPENIPWKNKIFLQTNMLKIKLWLVYTKAGNTNALK